MSRDDRVSRDDSDAMGTGRPSSPPPIINSQDPRRAAMPTPDAEPGAERPSLPPEVFSTAKPLGRYPGRRNPRKGDLILTIILSVVLYALVVQYVIDAAARAAEHADLVNGVQLANILAIAAPIVLAVFSTVFSLLFVLRRVVALWLPVVAGILVVALYSVTGDMLDQSIVNNFVR